MVWALEGLGWGGARSAPSHLTLPFLFFFWGEFFCCKDTKTKRPFPAMLQGSPKTPFLQCFFFCFLLFIFCLLLLMIIVFLCSFFFSFIPIQYFIVFLPLLIYLAFLLSFSILQYYFIYWFLVSCLFNFVISKTLPQTSLCSISFSCFCLLSYLSCVCLLFLLFWKHIFKVRGCNKTVFFNNPLFSKRQKLVLCFAYSDHQFANFLGLPQKQPSTPCDFLQRTTQNIGPEPTIKMPKIGPEPDLTTYICI